jgi:hypothetical protein
MISAASFPPLQETARAGHPHFRNGKQKSESPGHPARDGKVEIESEWTACKSERAAEKLLPAVALPPLKPKPGLNGPAAMFSPCSPSPHVLSCSPFSVRSCRSGEDIRQRGLYTQNRCFYDRRVFSTFSNLVLDHTEQAFTAANLGLIETSLFANLADDKVRLELKVDEARIREEFVGVFPSSSVEFSILNISLLDLIACSGESIFVAQTKFSCQGNFLTSGSEHESAPICFPGSVGATSLSETPHPQGICPNCLYQGPLIREEILACGPPSYWALCPACHQSGCTDDVVAGLAPAFIYLSKIEPLRLLSHPEVLLRLVIAAIVIVNYLLKVKVLRKGIANCQRTFFTHHGAHPPRAESQSLSGLLRGKVFGPPMFSQ